MSFMSYDQCQTLFSTKIAYVTLHETVPTTIEAKRELYQKVTMQPYVRGLKEPLGSRIRCMRPPTTEKALQFVQRELNIIYIQQRGNVTNLLRLMSSLKLRYNPYLQLLHYRGIISQCQCPIGLFPWDSNP